MDILSSHDIGPTRYVSRRRNCNSFDRFGGGWFGGVPLRRARTIFPSSREYVDASKAFQVRRTKQLLASYTLWHLCITYS